jgi:hypothetical protein
MWRAASDAKVYTKPHAEAQAMAKKARPKSCFIFQKPCGRFEEKPERLI